MKERNRNAGRREGENFHPDERIWKKKKQEKKWKREEKNCHPWLLNLLVVKISRVEHFQWMKKVSRKKEARNVKKVSRKRKQGMFTFYGRTRRPIKTNKFFNSKKKLEDFQTLLQISDTETKRRRKRKRGRIKVSDSTTSIHVSRSLSSYFIRTTDLSTCLILFPSSSSSLFLPFLSLSHCLSFYWNSMVLNTEREEEGN